MKICSHFSFNQLALTDFKHKSIKRKTCVSIRDLEILFVVVRVKSVIKLVTELLLGGLVYSLCKKFLRQHSKSNN